MDSDSLLNKVVNCLDFPLIDVRFEAVIFFTNLVNCVSEDSDRLNKLVFELSLFKRLTEGIISKDYEFSPD